MLCNRCGYENPDENYYCGHCGTFLREDQDFGVEPTSYAPSEQEVHAAESVEPQPSPDMYTDKSLLNRPSAWARSHVPISPATGRQSSAMPNGELQQEPAPADLDTGTGREHMPAGVSGPSFLGLDETPAESNSLDYLYEDDAPSRRRGAVFAILLLAAFASFVAYQWKQLPSWYTGIIKVRQNQPTQQAQQAANPAPTQASASDTQPSPNAQSAPTQSEPATQPGQAGAADQIQAQKGTAPGTPATTEAGDPSKLGNSPGNLDNRPTNTVNGSPAGNSGAAAEESAKRPEPAPSSGDKSGANERAQAGTEPAVSDEDESPDTTATSSEKAARAARAEPRARTSRDPSEQLLLRGQAYLYGKGAPRSCDQALVYLRKAADLGNAHARSQLGALYATGHCVALDRARAYSWLTLAANASNGRDIWIERNRRMLWNEMTETERARVRESMY